MPSAVSVYSDTPMIPALLIRTSILSTVLLMVAAAALMESKRVKSRGMNRALVEGLMVLISEITGVTLEAVRPSRMMFDGFPAARKRAVWAPRLPAVGPVITTKSMLVMLICRKVR